MDTRNLRDQVYEEIRLDILSGRLAQGQRISASELAERFHISSQPIRDALIRLTEEGLIRVRPRHGTFVTVVTAEKIVELNRAREMIETFSLQHADRSAIGRSDTWTMISTALDKMNQIVADPQYDYLQYNQWDYQYHLGLVQLGQNETITAIYRKLHPHYLYSMVMYHYATTMLGNHRDHIEMIAHLEANQVEQATTVCVRHIEQATATLLELMTLTAQ